MPHDPTDMNGRSEDDWRRNPSDDDTQQFAPFGDDPQQPRGRHAAHGPSGEEQQPRDRRPWEEPDPWARDEPQPDPWARDPRNDFGPAPNEAWQRNEPQPDPWAREEPQPDPWAREEPQPDPWARNEPRPDPWARDPRNDFAADDTWAREPVGSWDPDGDDSDGSEPPRQHTGRRSGRGVMVASLALAVIGILSAATGAGWFYFVQHDDRPTAADLAQQTTSRARGTDVPRDGEKASRHSRPTPATPSPTRTSASPKATPTRTSAAPSPTRAERRPAPAETTTKPKPRRTVPPPPAPEPEPTQESQATEYENEVVRLTNAERADAGCGALRNDERLRTAARGHSTDMAERNYFDHNSPDGTTPWDRMRRAGYNSPAAENIARGYPTPQAVVEGWMNSKGHRANIVNCSLKAIGVGVHIADGGPWWTQDFGSS